MAADRLVPRLVFQVEAINNAPFCAFYEQIRPLGEERIDSVHGEVTFFYPGVRGGQIDSLERLLVNAGFPYNLYCESAADSEVVPYWRPGMAASASMQSDTADVLSNSKFILSVRRACDELVYGQTGFAFGR